ncbi:hypothetical protein [Nostoc sp. C052]|uniref:hypothetical protein n=1 Tax=Nostoc sp. C052 TaxID=2576902 RepID=UPI0015C32741|nr:hypothetical protein [Nostoc sp. C052]
MATTKYQAYTNVPKPSPKLAEMLLCTPAASTIFPFLSAIRAYAFAFSQIAIKGIDE